ncbi:MAG: class I SAM-dependent methyltransferase [Candidatus Falkowbacteria bacterium]|nr:class I SAM-dependent methyltransferase [Candidatus Falkowbacteria bacterium]
MTEKEFNQVDSVFIAKQIIKQLNINYDDNNSLTDTENSDLEQAISYVEKIESDWQPSETDDSHSFGRKNKDEIIRLWSVPKKSAEVLKYLVKLTDAKNILEVGTSAGYAALHLAAGAIKNNGKVFTIELNPEKIKLAKEVFTKAKTNKITLLEGEASEIIADWDKGVLDFVFLDADKENYGKYFEQLIPLMKVGGIIVADNVNDYGHMMQDYLQKVSGTHLPLSRCDKRVISYYLAALDNGLMITKKISD